MSVLMGKVIVPGAAGGIALVSRQPISFWGGIDPVTGVVIDQRHDCRGSVISAKIFVFPHGKGSSTASAILMEMIYKGTAPAGIINSQVEPTLALGAVVADTIFSMSIPLIVLSNEDFSIIVEGSWVEIQKDGSVIVSCQNNSKP